MTRLNIKWSAFALACGYCVAVDVHETRWAFAVLWISVFGLVTLIIPPPMLERWLNTR